MAGNIAGRHRLGTPGLVHCVMYRQVAEALARPRTWWRAQDVARVRSRHSLAGLRRRAVVVAMERAWVPGRATDEAVIMANAA
jgi:hypothetical protein